RRSSDLTQQGLAGCAVADALADGAGAKAGVGHDLRQGHPLAVANVIDRLARGAQQMVAAVAVLDALERGGDVDTGGGGDMAHRHVPAVTQVDQLGVLARAARGDGADSESGREDSVHPRATHARISSRGAYGSLRGWFPSGRIGSSLCRNSIARPPVSHSTMQSADSEQIPPHTMSPALNGPMATIRPSWPK